MTKPESAARSLDAVLDSFALTEPKARESLTTGVPLTIWVPKDYKVRYVRLQKISDRRFCKVLRELFQAAIDRCDVEAAEAS